MKKGEKYDKKSHSTITGKNPGWKEKAVAMKGNHMIRNNSST